MSVFADLLQGFFTNKLINDRQASAHTIASYRDTMSLLLHYMSEVHGHHPDELTFAICNAEAIGGFLAYLETERGNSTSTRNTRLAAIRSFYRYASYRDPEDQALINQVLSIGPRRGTRHVVAYLTDPEIRALLGAPDQSCWHGQRDHALLHTAIYKGCAFRNSPTSSSPTCTLNAPGPTFNASARAARPGAHRWHGRPGTSWPIGYRQTACALTRFFSGRFLRIV